MPATRKPAPPERDGAAGFTLIEVLVAFAITVLVLGGFLQVFSGSLRTNRISDDYATAVSLAESKIAGIGILEPIEIGERLGRFDDRFRWRVAVRPFETAADPSRNTPLRPFHIFVSVIWGPAGSERSVDLNTLRLAAAN